MKFCASCKQNKPVNEFAKNATKKDGLQVSCRTCQKERDKVYYQRTKREHDLANKRLRLRNQRAVYEYLKTKSCVDCPIADPRVLTFDHVRGEKQGNISDMIKRPCSLKTIFDEIAKCTVRCFNCHMIKDCPRPIESGSRLMSSRALPVNLPVQDQRRF